ncbi:rhamnulose-1-phosphate aldolase/alcohol dehydrogenase [Spirosomataceae bacterium TFI 002]|nr:rhamnulose-1-phosphate aldolase/alcohol dehydrogenase [Spirosomataceae bacterium TFI 002]
MKQKNYKYVDYLWDQKEADKLNGNEVDLFIYRSNLLGADLRLTNYGGGNTSVKIEDQDPTSGEKLEVMWIKGSGGDIGTLTKGGCAALYLDRLRNLEKVYRGIEHEDEMVALFNHCIFDLNSKAPSIDTPLHAFLPYKHIDHLHPDAAIAIAAAKDGKKITHELFGGKIGWVEWQRPGFDLGLQLRDCYEEALSRGVELDGIMLGSHGLFTWANTSYESYVITLDVVEKCAEYIESKANNVFGGAKVQSLPQADRRSKASSVAPILRGLCSSYQHMIGHFSDADKVLEYVNSNDLERLAPMGTSCPDHFLRTKISPLVVEITDFDDLDGKLLPKFEAYRKMYEAYYNKCKHPNSPAMRDPNPVVILIPQVGMFTFAKDKNTARLASEYYVNAVNVMRGAEAISSYTSLPHQEAFNIEYWLLEEAKLQRRPKPKPLTGKVALITGSAGGIGKAIARKFAEEGGCVVLNDLNEERLEEAHQEFLKDFGKDAVSAVSLNVCDVNSISQAFDYANLAFGGVDILVNNAGISISKSITDHSIEEWDRLYDILVKGQFLLSQKAIEIMRLQKIGGDIINIVSKNAVVAGPNNPGYGSAKAAQAHLSRLMAAEVGTDKIRVNAVNPDAVIAGSNIWSGGWAEGRAKSYGVTVEELPAFYAKRTLLNEIIYPEDIANACFAFVGGLLSKSTGNQINVDGGVPMGFLR